MSTFRLEKSYAYMPQEIKKSFFGFALLFAFNIISIYVVVFRQFQGFFLFH